MHRAVVEAGPATIRRHCCGTSECADVAAALEWIDEPVALVDGQPVAAAELLHSVLACPQRAGSMQLIHPSWWPGRRVDLVTTAARTLVEDVVAESRSTVLSATFRAAAVVEIAASLVAITGTRTLAEPRLGPPGQVAAAVARQVLAVVGEKPATVVIDAPADIGGAGALAAMIAERLPAGLEAVTVDELVTEEQPVPEPEPAPARHRRPRWPLAAAAALAVVALGLSVPPPAPVGVPTTYLMEGRVAVQVPADWPVRRVAAGPGSARVEAVSPVDPELILHLTQAPAPGETLAAVVEPLQRALELAEAETPGVFVGFDSAGSSAGRPAVTYREVRDGHHVDWVVLVDHAVRIGIGCQSGPGGDDALRPVCEQAVRSAHAVTPAAAAAPPVASVRVPGRHAETNRGITHIRQQTGTGIGSAQSNHISANERDEGADMATPSGAAATTTLNADFDVMHAVAAATDARNEEIRGMLQSFVTRMRAVPPSVWSGMAAARFQDVLDRWNTESLRLHHALARIAETIRHNERALREVAETHSHHIEAAGDGI